jgi:sugar phosphate permease
MPHTTNDLSFKHILSEFVLCNKLVYQFGLPNIYLIIYLTKKT